MESNIVQNPSKSLLQKGLIRKKKGPKKTCGILLHSQVFFDTLCPVSNTFSSCKLLKTLDFKFYFNF